MITPNLPDPAEMTPRHVAPSSFQPSQLHCFVVRMNPMRYTVPDQHYLDFVARLEAAGVVVYTVEIAFGERSHVLTDPDNPRHLQVRSPCAMWFKEQALNLLIRRTLPADAQYIAWIDADVEFQRTDWATETIEMLQHHPVVQMFSQAVDLGPKGQFLKQHAGFGWCWRRYRAGGDEHVTSTGGSYGGTWHSGYAWACTREFFRNVGGLPEFCILGSADRDFACAMIGEIDKRLPYAPQTSYADKLRLMQERCLRAGSRNLGYVEGGLLHHHHGPKKSRGYGDRFKILQKHAFDPDRHLVLDESGLWRFTPDAHELAVDIQIQLGSRNEDSPEI